MRDKLTAAVGKPHLSYSSLKYALGDMKLWEMYMRGQLKKESEALYFGSLYDMLLFEPEKAHDTYFVLDDTYIVERMTKNGARIPVLLKNTGTGRPSNKSFIKARPSQVKQTGLRLTK